MASCCVAAGVILFPGLPRHAPPAGLRGLTTFRNGYIGDYKLPPSTVWLMSGIAEAKGRQDLYTRQSPQLLQALRDMAMVESMGSSHRIEGVTSDLSAAGGRDCRQTRHCESV
jgi:hypothetical protein